MAGEKYTVTVKENKDGTIGLYYQRAEQIAVLPTEMREVNGKKYAFVVIDRENIPALNGAGNVHFQLGDCRQCFYVVPKAGDKVTMPSANFEGIVDMRALNTGGKIALTNIDTRKTAVILPQEKLLNNVVFFPTTGEVGVVDGTGNLKKTAATVIGSKGKGGANFFERDKAEDFIIEPKPEPEGEKTSMSKILPRETAVALAAPLRATTDLKGPPSVKGEPRSLA